MRIQIGMALAGALLLAISTPPGLFPGAWVFLPLGLALLFEASRESRGPRGLLAVYLAGAFYLLWMSWSLRHLFFGLPLLLCPVIGGLYWLFMAWLWRRSEARLGLRFQPWFFALIWVFVEWARAEMPEIGYPQSYGILGLYLQPGLLRPVAVLGIVGQSLLVALLGSGLWALIFGQGKIWIRSLPILVSLVLWMATSLWTPGLQPKGQPLRVALMQPATPTFPGDPDWERFQAMDSLEDYLQEFQGFARSIPLVDLVVWPEAFASRIPEAQMDLYCKVLSSYLGAGQRTLFGASLQEQVTKDYTLRRNAALLVDKKGKLLGRHEKKRLVPLGESLPLWEEILPRSTLLSMNAWLRESSGWPLLVKGRPQEILSLAGHPFGVPICYENAFASVLRAETLRGAEFFCVLSFENWYRQGNELDQLLALSVFGAIEMGRPLLRCTNDGITALIDERGVILREGNPGQREALLVEVQPMTGAHPALWLGAWLPWILAFLSLIPLIPFLSASGKNERLDRKCG